MLSLPFSNVQARTAPDRPGSTLRRRLSGLSSDTVMPRVDSESNSPQPEKAASSEVLIGTGSGPCAAAAACTLPTSRALRRDRRWHWLVSPGMLVGGEVRWPRTLPWEPRGTQLEPRTRRLRVVAVKCGQGGACEHQTVARRLEACLRGAAAGGSSLVFDWCVYSARACRDSCEGVPPTVGGALY